MENDGDKSNFFAKGTSENGKDDFIFSLSTDTPESALELTLNKISGDWSGGIEILADDSSEIHPMPLIDYWKD